MPLFKKSSSVGSKFQTTVHIFYLSKQNNWTLLFSPYIFSIILFQILVSDNVKDQEYIRPPSPLSTGISSACSCRITSEVLTFVRRSPNICIQKRKCLLLNNLQKRHQNLLLLLTQRTSKCNNDNIYLQGFDPTGIDSKTKNQMIKNTSE